MNDQFSSTEAAGSPDGATLAMERAEFERLGRRVVTLIAEHLEGLRDRRVRPEPSVEVLDEVLAQSLPEAGAAPEDILDYIESRVLPYPTGNGHPRFFAWVVSPPAPVAVLSDAIASGMNIMGGGAAPLPTRFAHCTARWLMEAVGFPTEDSIGLLVSGGSMANLTGIAVARHWAAKQDDWDLRTEGLQGDRPALRVYASEEAHSCIQKSVELLGLGSANLRLIPVDRDCRIQVAALRTAIAEDRQAGHRPFCVVGNAGTVNTGAVDPLDALADVCAEEELWFHIDGAYGALGVCDPVAAPRFAGMARARSLALDPHKWLSVPLDCGCILVRDRDLQRDAFSVVPPYLAGARHSDPEQLPLPFEHSFELSRGFKALKVWATLMHLGHAGLQNKISRNNALARRLADAVETAPDLELLAPISLSIVCFRFAPPGWTGNDAGLDALNKAINDTINASGEFFFTPTTLAGRYALRACIIHYATTESDIDQLVRCVRETGAGLAARQSEP